VKSSLMVLAALMFAPAVCLMMIDPDTVILHGTRVSIWPVRVDTALEARLWAWDSTCATHAVQPLPGHGWRNVTWLGANLVEAGNDPAAQVDTSLGIGKGVLGFWEGDSIFLDTGVVHRARPWFMHNILAHELLHQLLHARVPIDTSIPERIREVPDSAHPLFPFLYPCRLMYLGVPVVDSEGYQ
jgi:hypothetical protein